MEATLGKRIAALRRDIRPGPGQCRRRHQGCQKHGGEQKSQGTLQPPHKSFHPFRFGFSVERYSGSGEGRS